MSRPLFAFILAGTLLFAGGRAHAQGTTRTDGAGPSPAGFSYGGAALTMGDDLTIRSTTYPAVRGVRPGGPAERAGIAVGDTIVSVNGRDARIQPLLPGVRSGATYVLRLRRNGEEMEVTLKVEPPPAARDTAARMP